MHNDGQTRVVYCIIQKHFENKTKNVQDMGKNLKNPQNATCPLVYRVDTEILSYSHFFVPLHWEKRKEFIKHPIIPI